MNEKTEARKLFFFFPNGKMLFCRMGFQEKKIKIKKMGGDTDLIQEILPIIDISAHKRSRS